MIRPRVLKVRLLKFMLKSLKRSMTRVLVSRAIVRRLENDIARGKSPFLENISSRLVPLKTIQYQYLFLFSRHRRNQKLQVWTYNRIQRKGITRRQGRPLDESVPKIKYFCISEIDPLEILPESIWNRRIYLNERSLIEAASYCMSHTSFASINK